MPLAPEQTHDQQVSSEGVQRGREPHGFGFDNGHWTNPLRGSRDFGRGSDFAGWVGDKHPRLPLAGQLNRETMTWRHVALFVSQRSCQ